MDPILQQIIAFAQANGIDPRALFSQMSTSGMPGQASKSAAPGMPAPAQMGPQGQGRMPTGPVGVAMPQGMAQGMPAGMPAPQGIAMGMPRDDRMASAAMPNSQMNAEAGKAAFLAGKAPPSAITAKEGLSGMGGGGMGNMAGLASLGMGLLSASKTPPPQIQAPSISAYRYDPRMQNLKYDPNLLTGLFQ
jgi:hypothetical protein